MLVQSICGYLVLRGNIPVEFQAPLSPKLYLISPTQVPHRDICALQSTHTAIAIHTVIANLI
jgi:hypothetical protein